MTINLYAEYADINDLVADGVCEAIVTCMSLDNSAIVRASILYFSSSILLFRDINVPDSLINSVFSFSSFSHISAVLVTSQEVIIRKLIISWTVVFSRLSFVSWTNPFDLDLAQKLSLMRCGLFQTWPVARATKFERSLPLVLFLILYDSHPRTTHPLRWCGCSRTWRIPMMIKSLIS